MARFFEGSLEELTARNADIKTRYSRIDARRFNAHIYRNGQKQSECSVRIGGFTRENGIVFSHDVSASDSSMNEMLSVDADDQSLYLQCMGFQSHGREGERKLTPQGAAEYYWSLLLEPLQR